MKEKEVPVEIGSAEWAILERAYRLVVHMRDLKTVNSQQETVHLTNQVQQDIGSMRDILRAVSALVKDIEGKARLSRNTEVEGESLSHSQT